MARLDGGYGYDGFFDYLYVEYINRRDTLEDKLDFIKYLYSDDEESYYKWKQWCMEWSRLSDVFGTLDNPIEIDESKL